MYNSLQSYWHLNSFTVALFVPRDPFLGVGKPLRCVSWLFCPSGHKGSAHFSLSDHRVIVASPQFSENSTHGRLLRVKTICLSMIMKLISWLSVIQCCWFWLLCSCTVHKAEETWSLLWLKESEWWWNVSPTEKVTSRWTEINLTNSFLRMSQHSLCPISKTYC